MTDKILNTTERKEFESGDVEYYRNGVLHNEDAPAVDRANGERYWYKYGVLHRIGGPAVYMPNGTSKYFIDGKEFTEEEYLDKKTFNHTLTVTISGPAGSGKTILSHYLHKHLTYAGFACKNNDLEMTTEKMIKIDEIVSSLKDRTGIIIDTKMSYRNNGATNS